MALGAFLSLAYDGFGGVRGPQYRCDGARHTGEVAALSRSPWRRRSMQVDEQATNDRSPLSRDQVQCLRVALPRWCCSAILRIGIRCVLT